MSLIQCPACKRDIDSGATRCPWCTSELKTKAVGAGSTSATLYGVFAGVLLGAIFGTPIGLLMGASWQSALIGGVIICGTIFGLITNKLGVNTKVRR